MADGDGDEVGGGVWKLGVSATTFDGVVEGVVVSGSRPRILIRCLEALKTIILFFLYVNW